MADALLKEDEDFLLLEQSIATKTFTFGASLAYYSQIFESNKNEE